MLICAAAEPYQAEPSLAKPCWACYLTSIIWPFSEFVFWIKRVRALMQGLWAQCTKSPIDSHESQKKVTFSTWCMKNEIFLIHVVKNNLRFTLGLDFYLFNSACCCTWLQIFFSLQNSVENSYLISISKEDFRIFSNLAKTFSENCVSKVLLFIVFIGRHASGSL